MNGSEVIKQLWDFVVGLAQAMGEVWNWLTDSHYIGLKIEWLGIDFGFDIVPLQLTGVVLIILVGLLFVKTFIPVA